MTFAFNFEDEGASWGWFSIYLSTYSMQKKVLYYLNKGSFNNYVDKMRGVGGGGGQKNVCLSIIIYAIIQSTFRLFKGQQY